MTALHERLLELKSRLGLKYEEDERTMDEAATALQGSGGEVVAWALRDEADGTYWQFFTDNDAGVRRAAIHGDTLVPLYASPAQPSDAKDAARWRWLRSHESTLEPLFAECANGFELLEGEALDAAADAAMLTAAPAPIEQEG